MERTISLGNRGVIRMPVLRQLSIAIICAFFLILFIYTGLNKLMEYDDFKLQMERSPFIGNMAGLIAATLPSGELLIALALILKKYRLLGLYLSLFLMALFTGYIWLMLQYAPDLPCTCGGILTRMSWQDHLVFNGAATLFAIAGIFLVTRENAVSKVT